MKRFIALFAFFVGFNLYAAEPIEKVPSNPSAEELETYTESENIFSYKILELYKTASVLEAQLTLLGITPTVKPYAPSLDELSGADETTYKKYYKIAASIQKQVEQAPNGLVSARLTELKNRLDKVNTEAFLAGEAKYNLEQDNKNCNFYKENYRKLIGVVDSLRFVGDSLYFAYKKAAWKQSGIFQNYYEGKTPSLTILSVGLVLNQFYFNDERIESGATPGITIGFNPSPILGFGRYLEIFGEYDYIKSTAKVNRFEEFGLTSHIELASVGMKLNFPLSQAIGAKNIDLNFKLGAGFFWANANAINTSMPDNSWHGQLISLELGVNNPSPSFPIGAYVGYKFYNSVKDIRFATFNGPINLGQPWINSLNFGLKFMIWRSPNF